MPRALSSVTARAPAMSSAGATQTLSTPSTGAIQLRYLPSGLICTLARSGLPNSASRGISSPSSLEVGAAAGVALAVVAGGSGCRSPQAAGRTARHDARSTLGDRDIHRLIGP